LELLLCAVEVGEAGEAVDGVGALVEFDGLGFVGGAGGVGLGDEVVGGGEEGGGVVVGVGVVDGVGD